MRANRAIFNRKKSGISCKRTIILRFERRYRAGQHARSTSAILTIVISHFHLTHAENNTIDD
jgi:hypothetical protein